MKAISFKQPHAEQIAAGHKRIEYRNWRTEYRGKLLVCASLSGAKAMPVGCTVCIVDLIGIQQSTRSNWRYAWLIDNPVRVPEHPIKGKLSLFNPPTDITKALQKFLD